MIPVKLSVRNFMCYRDNVPPLYLDGIHTACLCGGNGNGKSALLDAITWALWGKARAKSDDELIHLGQREMEVDFEFRVDENRYCVLRKHAKTRLGRSGQTLLDFQVAAPNGFSSISGNNLGETQQKIIRILRMDYPTFINSAFLRQGHADEFTIKPPAKRKKVLANILGLSFYDELEQRAKEYAREREQMERELEHSIKEMEQEISLKGEYELKLQQLREALAGLDRQVKEQDSQVKSLREAKNALQLKQERLVELKGEIEREKEELGYWQNQVEEHVHKVEEYEKVIQRGSEVEMGYARLQTTKKESEELNIKLGRLAALRERKSELDRVIQSSKGELSTQQRLAQSKVEEWQARSDQIPQLEQDLASERAKLDNIAQKDKELEEKRRQAQELALYIQHLKSSNAQLEQELEESRAKLTLLKQGDVRCPLCETELGVVGKQRVEEKYEVEISARVNVQQRNELEIGGGEKRHRSLKFEISESELRVNQQRAEAQSKAAVLEREISRAKQAATELLEGKARLTQLGERLAKGDFAVAEQIKLKEVEQQIAELGYDAQRHQQLRQLLAELEKYEALQRRLEEAGRFLPSERAALDQARGAVVRWNSTLEKDKQKAEALSNELAALPGLISRLTNAEQAYNGLLWRQTEIRDKMVATQEKLARCSELEGKRQEKQQSLLWILRERKIYEELAEAFGKRGVQAILIESAIPEIEIEANKLLSRLTDNQMSVRIETQRETKKGETIETLDIKISDELGTRTYEMYSGGEAFRINFSLRIALSKLLAKRAGAPLPTLFIDEGFGTQDTSGLGKLVEAINSIREDFEKIIVITHLEELKDAFPVRIEVTKTAEGSTISVN